TFAGSRIWLLADPVDWAFVIAGAVLGVRAWHLAADAGEILPEEARVVSVPRKLGSRGLQATTGIYALLCLGWVGISGYQESSHLLQRGVDPRREQDALLAFNEGASHANRGDLGAAEKAFQRALSLWEALAPGRSAPSVYRVNLALTLNNLGWLR